VAAEKRYAGRRDSLRRALFLQAGGEVMGRSVRLEEYSGTSAALTPRD